MDKSVIHHRTLGINIPRLSAISLALTIALISCNTTPKNTDANGTRKPWRSANANAAAVRTGFLTDQEWVSATNGWGPVERGRSNGSGEANDGAKIKIAGQEYDQGFGIHADSSITFNLDPSCSSFKASIGLDDEVRWQSEHGSIIFRVYGDQQQLFDSGVMNRDTATKDIVVDLKSGQYSTLTLVVDQNRNSTEGDFSGWQDHADWANARVECGSSSPPPSNVLRTGYLGEQMKLSFNQQNGWGPIEIDQENGDQRVDDGDPITINGKTFQKGLGVHASSSLEFPLAGQCSNFTASVGVDDVAKAKPSTGGTVDFQVLVDGAVRYDSQVMKRGQSAKLASVNLTPTDQVLKLVVTDAGDGIDYDHGDWADAQVTCGAVSNPPPSNPPPPSPPVTPPPGPVQPGPPPPPVTPPATGPTTTANYAQSLENFPNPERGFAFENDVAWPAQTPWGFCGQGDNFAQYNYTAWNDPLNLDFLRQERAQGRAVVMSRYHIADFRNRDLTAEYLNFLQRDFDTARQAGVKIGMRFAYNYPMGGPDAPLAIILRHIQQLQPLFAKNADVIAYLETGFVGCWGEWHHSANGLTGDNTSRDGYISDGGRQIVDALLGALPSDRMIAIRYPRLKFDYFGSNDWLPIAPLTASQAFSGSNRARIGHHDDCFVCSDTHGGAYFNPRGDLGEVPRFLEPENLFVVQEGEPGDVEADPNLGSCQTILQELSSKHWSVVGLFNLASSASVIQRWKRDGCYDEISRNLGYRYRLLTSEVSSRATRGSGLLAKFSITNDGWANMYNPRMVELVLRSQTTGAVRRLKIFDDARLKMPFPGETRNLEATVNVPTDLEAGKYDVLLALPDPTSSLHDRPEYAIQLANQSVWESNTGWNKLGHTLEIQ